MELIILAPLRSTSDPDTATFAEPLRITPAELLRLHMESAHALGEIRAEATWAEIEYQRRLNRWHEDGRVAVDSMEPEVALLARVLEALRRQALAPV
ncbi:MULTISPECIES: hypothetical protein [unclassified Streptomyces]|uniref:hypothetical protein n=1 Tax=unclassified Streptomyces TaxID=2593676 RepID=UPI0023652651|nr:MULTISPECIES: hypothetical protein [unclassified Streptomyces]MDF3143529.1 hypothetical protein [Streptomyces sp. T21Q-yed]WDF37831.1 hypothetical protein PBV52_13980 [Streptomyces sp. T12]